MNLGSSEFGTVTKAELHAFSDASTQGYGACVYLRLCDEKETINVSLVLDKARVTPSNATTITRLELQAAVLSAVLSDFVEKQLHNIQITDTDYYTDSSEIVLGYLRNEVKRFHVFVSNRVQKIRTMKKPADWYYVPSALNSANHASRGLSAEQLSSSIWTNGPPFPNMQPIQLPKQPDHMTLADLDTATSEVKKTATTCSTLTTSTLLVKLQYFSNWTKMVKFIVLLENCTRRKLKNTILDQVTGRKKAETSIIKLLQKNCFHQELSLLRQGKPLQKSSVLYKPNPILYSDGLLRVGGRLQHSDYLDYKEKHPVVIPKASHVTDLLIRHYHHKSAHQGCRGTLGQLRLNGFWIVGAHSAVSTVIHKCVICKKLRAKPENPQMAPLSSKRTEATPPFSYVGCDIFGPYVIKEKRKELKKYGTIFVCMASKAIHIKVVDDMTTDAFLNALRCLIAIRGPIRQLHTDNGSNFIGAANELRKEMQTNGDITKFSNEHNIEFVTNVPYSSHMGGIWERQIRTIQAILNGLLKTHSCRLDTSTLRTLMYEVMAIINC
ncbi:uncharacterized protein [Watersipora subatra]|uniref:uncharacterized protein n=1 Tax=Watersipora subatra TaxID=2589382 RepID=UPI00355C4027